MITKPIINQEFGLVFYQAECNTGETFEFKSFTPNNELDTDSKDYCCVVISGSFNSENDFRDPMTFSPTKMRVADGLVLPGNNKFTALEDNSVYACVSAIQEDLRKYLEIKGMRDIPYFRQGYELTHLFMEAGDEHALSSTGPDVAVVCISGEAKILDTVIKAQQIYVANEEEVVTSTESGHFCLIRKI